MKEEIRKMIAAVPETARNPGDYLGPDGLLYCGRCKTKKQFAGTMFGTPFLVPALCECEQKKLQEENEERRRREECNRIRAQKAVCIHDRALLNATFEKDDGSLPQIRSARRYVETWEERKKKNEGLLLWGDVGTGKTFFAGCIANALIERGVPVLMTNFSKILNQLSGMYTEDKNAFISGMMKYSLLIIDDLGVERQTDYALEQVYNIIDERYKTNLPLIVTTNLSLIHLQEPQNTAYKRIYDRILAMCVPIRFVGTSHRKAQASEKFAACRADLLL